MSTVPSIPEWGTIYTVKFQPKVSLGLELWRVAHRIPKSFRSSLPETEIIKTKDVEDTTFDIATVHNVLPGGTADLHLGADIQQGDLLISLNGDSLVGYFRSAKNLKLESLLHIVADCPIQRTLWFFRPSHNSIGQKGNLRFPIDCAYLTPLLITRWQPPPDITQLRVAKANLKPTEPIASLVPVGQGQGQGQGQESIREKTPDTHGYVGPEGGIPHGSDRRPETAPQNIRLLEGKIIQKGLFLPEGEGILMFAEKKLRSILYDVRVNVETEVQRMKDDETVLDGEFVEEEETVSEEGHVEIHRMRKRRVLTFHCRELYHGTPLYGTDVFAQKSESEIMEMVRTNPTWASKIAKATGKMAMHGGKTNLRGMVNKTIRELLLKMMDLGNAPGDRRKFLLEIRVPRPLRKSLRRKVSSKAMLTSGVGAGSSVESLESLVSLESSGVSPENSIAEVTAFDSMSDLGIETVVEEEEAEYTNKEIKDETNGENGENKNKQDIGTTPISSVTKFNILESLHDTPTNLAGRPVSALITSEHGSRGSSRPSTAPAREGKEKENSSERKERETKQEEKTESGPSTDDISTKRRRRTTTTTTTTSSSSTATTDPREEQDDGVAKRNQKQLPPVKRPRSKPQPRKQVSSIGTAMTPETTISTTTSVIEHIRNNRMDANKLSPVAAAQSVPNLGTITALSALQLDDASLRLQKVDTLRTQQNVTLMQIVEIEKRLEEQRLEMLQTAMPGDVRKLLRAFRHEREAAARNIRKVVAKQRADLRSAMVRYSVEFLGRSSQMRPVATGSMHMGSTMSARDASQGSDSGGGLNLGMSGNERDVLYDMGSAGNMMGNVTGFTPTLSSMGSAILDDPSSTSLPPLHRQ